MSEDPSSRTFLSRNRCGLLLRAFAPEPGLVEARVAQVVETVERAKLLLIDGQHVFSRIDIVVFADTRFRETGAAGIGSRSDCGQTADRLKTAIRSAGLPAHVHEVRRGDLYCGVLNYGIAQQMRDRVGYTTILSTEARGHLHACVMDRLFTAITKGAKAVGVLIEEINGSIVAGRLSNTFALWDNVALASVGMFDPRAAAPLDDRAIAYARGAAMKDEIPLFYPMAGVEEVIPLARLVETYGRCLATTYPSGKEGVIRYEMPDPVIEPERYRRYASKFRTKFERQKAMLASIGRDLHFLETGLIGRHGPTPA